MNHGAILFYPDRRASQASGAGVSTIQHAEDFLLEAWQLDLFSLSKSLLIRFSQLSSAQLSSNYPVTTPYYSVLLPEYPRRSDIPQRQGSSTGFAFPQPRPSNDDWFTCWGKNLEAARTWFPCRRSSPWRLSLRHRPSAKWCAQTPKSPNAVSRHRAPPVSLYLFFLSTRSTSVPI